MMFAGRVLSLHICARGSAPMDSPPEIACVAGKGIAGDRYLLGTGTYSAKPREDRQITFLEVETLRALKRDHAIDLAAAETRRNVVTEGVPLNHLVGRRFRVGAVVVEGLRLNVPCQYLEDLTAKPGLFKALIHRSGLNCRILEGGVMRPGDAVTPLD
ncbi:MAG: MOSC domain-containing protein [Alphaproteobacteria bacterium]|nr:MOSC domain-containing protein [Alphaproteobacteria bacterium]